MNANCRHFFAALTLCATTACGTAAPTTSTTSTTSTATTVTATTTTTTAPHAPFSVRVLLTSDEHGWLLPWKDKKAAVSRGGIHAIAGAMRAEGYSADAPSWLLLSSGDMWTGPYETTVLEGAPMTASMSHLGYNGAAVGNHEFDFGQHVVAERARTATFPFLAANLVESATNTAPAWAKPYVIVEQLVDDGSTVRIAIVGLACVQSPVTADVRNMVGLAFQPYDEALRRWLPEIKQQQPDAIVVVAHDSISSVRPVLPLLRKYGVGVVAAGHEHKSGIFVDDNGTAAANDDIVVCNPGPYLRSFCRVDLGYAGGAVVSHAEKVLEVSHPLDAPAPPFDATLAAIVQGAEASATRIGGEVLIESKQRLGRGKEGSLGQLVVDAWLRALPYAQVAVTNAGGLRQDIDVGPLRIRDIVSALPFNNYLLVVDMKGKELKTILANPESVVGGVSYRFTEAVDGTRTVTAVTLPSGKPVGDDDQLKVVINDFMFRGGDHYAFSDVEPEETAVDWREPVFRALRAEAAHGLALDRAPAVRAIRD